MNIIDIIKEEIVKLYNEGITGIGGVMDRAAERRFNIPNEFRDLERKANSAVNTQSKEDNTINGTYVTELEGQGESSSIFLNPKSLKNIGRNVRGIIDRNGNLYTEVQSYTTHDVMIKKLSPFIRQPS